MVKRTSTKGFAHLHDRVDKALPDDEDMTDVKKIVEGVKATIDESKFLNYNARRGKAFKGSPNCCGW